MKIDLVKEAAALAPELFALRRQIHMYPELGDCEYATAEKIEKILRESGIEVERPVGTAVVGVLRGGGPGKTVALRADMDALPIEEMTGAAFASRTHGVMHACGHDVHIAALCGAAKLLAAHREELCGTVRFLFEPNEEGSGGAQRMIAAGCMEGVDAVFGAHVVPDLPLGTVGVRYGKFYAASDMFTVTVHGKSAHGAQPERGIDALAAAARMVTVLHTLPERLAPERCVVSIGTLQAGTAGNIIADCAEFSGIIRTLGADSRAAVKRDFCAALERIAAETGTRVEIALHESYAGIVNTDEESALVQQTAQRLFGAERVEVLTEPTMTTEDFGCFIEAARGAFYHFGGGCCAALHNAAFLPQEESILTAAALHAAVAAAYLERT